VSKLSAKVFFKGTNSYSFECIVSFVIAFYEGLIRCGIVD